MWPKKKWTWPYVDSAVNSRRAGVAELKGSHVEAAPVPCAGHPSLLAKGVCSGRMEGGRNCACQTATQINILTKQREEKYTIRVEGTFGEKIFEITRYI